MHSLIPFSPDKGIEKVELSAEVRGEKNLLIFEYRLLDPQQKVMDSPRPHSWRGEELPRMDGLWQSTCFEAFISVPGEAPYWEINISPKGAWQAYRFDEYRKPQPPRVSHDLSLSKLVTRDSYLRAEFTTHISFSRIELSFCAVLQPKLSGPVSYYSSHHAGPKPDFHLRSSFNIEFVTL